MSRSVPSCEVKNLICISTSFCAEDRAFLLHVPTEAWGLRAEASGLISKDMRRHPAWPSLSAQQTCGEEGSLGQAGSEGWWAAYSSVLCVTHQLLLRWALAPGSAHQLHPASWWGALKGTAVILMNFVNLISLCRLLSNSVFYLMPNLVSSLKIKPLYITYCKRLVASSHHPFPFPTPHKLLL